jgi:hypothetical protein
LGMYFTVYPSHNLPFRIICIFSPASTPLSTSHHVTAWDSCFPSLVFSLHPVCVVQVFADPYKATITKEKGREIEEVEEDVYETYNLACLLINAKTDDNFKSQGVRINGSKFTVLRELPNQTYIAKVRAIPPRCLLVLAIPVTKVHMQIDGESHNVTLEQVYVLKSKEAGLVIGVKGGYYFAARYKSDPRSDPSLAVAEDLAIGFYWACGPDA